MYQFDSLCFPKLYRSSVKLRPLRGDALTSVFDQLADDLLTSKAEQEGLLGLTGDAISLRQPLLAPLVVAGLSESALWFWNL